MPDTPKIHLTHPGVSIQEIPGGARTIAAVPTSIAAFVGRAARGPDDRPVTLESFADFERVFGGLWAESALGFAVRDFFVNGGGQAIVVRAFRPSAAGTGRAKIQANGLDLEAYPGAWASTLRVRIDHDVSAEDAAGLDLATADLFNLTLHDTKSGAMERFQNLTVEDGERRADGILERESMLAKVIGPLPSAVPAAHAEPGAGKTVWEDDDASSTVAAGDHGNDGDALAVDDFIGEGREATEKGLYALEKAHGFNLLCIPPYRSDGNVDYATLIGVAASYCEKRRAMLLVDSPREWANTDDAKRHIGDIGTTSPNAALFFPRLEQPNPLHGDQVEEFAPSGAVAGVFARTDVERGVWKAPAGTHATLKGVAQLSVSLDDAENGELNPLGINCLRTFPTVGTVVWGSRTLQGDDRGASQWKYVAVRRLALFIEQSIYAGTQWVSFEPNDESLWAQIRVNVGAFMHGLFRQGALQGVTPKEAYFVICDETTSQQDIDGGEINIIVGFAPLKPAEFVVLQIRQMAGQGCVRTAEAMNVFAIAAVTRGVSDLLRNGLRGFEHAVLPPEAGACDASVEVTTLPPDEARARTDGTCGINLFLYQVALHHGLGAAAVTLQAPLALSLRYLVTAYGPDDEIAHLVLGRAMSILDEHPVLGRAELENAFPERELHQEIGAVRVIAQPLSLDDMSKLWTMCRVPYRISAAYEATFVIETPPLT